MAKKKVVREKALRLPEKVRVAGLDFAVRLDPLHCARQQVYGMADYKKQEIVLDPTMSRDMIAATFLHELIHVINFQYGVQKLVDDVLEERITNAVSNGLFAAIKDNNLTF